MTVLYFLNPVFVGGENITVRRGTKWDNAPKKEVYIVDTKDPLKEDGETKVLHVVDISTRVFRFSDLRDSDLISEHDPKCRTVEGLLSVMKRTYPGFDERELVTIVSFNIFPF